jgi:hypothetical protein
VPARFCGGLAERNHAGQRIGELLGEALISNWLVDDDDPSKCSFDLGTKRPPNLGLVVLLKSA